MIENLEVQNFRSIKSASIDLGRITVLTGANNSGKSSILYALQVLKNLIVTPNQSIEDALNFSYLNLGGIKDIAFNQNLNKSIEIAIKSKGKPVPVESEFSVQLSTQNSYLINGIFPYKFQGKLPVSFPNTLKYSTEMRVSAGADVYSVRWNGYEITDLNLIAAGISSRSFDYERVSNELNAMISLPLTDLFALNVTPTQRGFFKPIYNPIPLNGQINSEEEVAAHMSIDKNLQYKVAHYFNKITNKHFQIDMGSTGGFFYLKVRDNEQPFVTELVNQGMGFNQIVFLLAKILYDKNSLVCIDEPEIHLHPSMIEQFVKVLVEIAEKENKQFLFSTHSEHWLMSLLAEVAEGHLSADDLKVYYLTKEGKETKIEEQEVNEQGQLKGGLKNFIEAEMRLTDRFFNAKMTS